MLYLITSVASDFNTFYMRCDNCGWDNPDNTTLCVKCNTILQNIPQENKAATTSPQRTGGGAFAGTISDGSAFAGTIPDSASAAGATAAEAASMADADKDVMVPCPNPGCGYLNSRYVKACVRCKTPLSTAAGGNVVGVPAAGESAPAVSPARTVPDGSRPQPTVPDRNYSRKAGAGTIDPYRMKIDSPPACHLRLVPRDGEHLDKETAEKEFVAGETPIPLNRTNLDATNNSITSKVQAELVFENGKWLLSDRSELHTTFIRVGEKTELKEGDIIIMGDRKFIFTADND